MANNENSWRSGFTSKSCPFPIEIVGPPQTRLPSESWMIELRAVGLILACIYIIKFLSYLPSGRCAGVPPYSTHFLLLLPLNQNPCPMKTYLFYSQPLSTNRNSLLDKRIFLRVQGKRLTACSLTILATLALSVSAAADFLPIPLTPD